MTRGFLVRGVSYTCSPRPLFGSSISTGFDYVEFLLMRKDTEHDKECNR